MAMKVNGQWCEGREHVCSNLNKPIAAQQMPAPGHDLTKFIKEAYIGQNCCHVKMKNAALKWELLILSCLHDELRLKN